MSLIFVLLIFFCTLQISHAQYFKEAQRDLDFEAYQLADNPEVVIIQISPKGLLTNRREGRQEDEDEDEVNTTPYIPAIIPGVTKIFNGILTGNLNEIFHGSTSFAPKQTANAINTVYNQVVGLPPPKTPGPSTEATVATNATVNGTVVSVTSATTVAPDDDDEDSDSDIDYPNRPTLPEIAQGQEGPQPPIVA